ncbi:MAG: hypothetical protein HC819_21240 [Cyclobacteriaceae bacterium]|nr:hypothetical protein [Cyclobacteriaceae bacterium]
MKKILYLSCLFIVSIVLVLASCSKSDDPEPTSLKFNTTAATFDGAAISPVPTFTLTVNFDGDGNPTTYQTTGAGTLTPALGSSGTWTATGNVVKFTTSSGAMREVNGSINTTSGNIALTYALSKLDQGVYTDEVGTYVYNMTVQ